MAQSEKEELKTIKVKASTHARLSIIATIYGNTIAELIDDLLESGYPDLVQETDKLISQGKLRGSTPNARKTPRSG